MTHPCSECRSALEYHWLVTGYHQPVDSGPHYVRIRLVAAKNHFRIVLVVRAPFTLIAACVDELSLSTECGIDASPACTKPLLSGTLETVDFQLPSLLP